VRVVNAYAVSDRTVSYRTAFKPNAADDLDEAKALTGPASRPLLVHLVFLYVRKAQRNVLSTTEKGHNPAFVSMH
jgi:hypothetical protein